MAAAAGEQYRVQTQIGSSSKRAVKRLRVRRRRPISKFKSYLKHLTFLFILTSVFAYVNIYAELTLQGFNRSELLAICRQEKLRNERLKIDYIRFSSPNWVVSAAEKTGMVYAKDYDYVTQSETVASVAHQGSN